MDRAYLFRVIRPIDTPPPRAADAVAVMHEFDLNIGADLQWVREHADEIATRLVGTDYIALWVDAAVSP